MRIKRPLPSNWRVFCHLFMGEVSDWVSSSPGKNGANLVSKLAACLKRSSNGDRLSAVWKALFIPGFLNFLKCPGLALFSYWRSLHVLYVDLHAFALLWPFSVDPTFSNATIGRLCTMPALYWSNYFSVNSFSKYKNKAKPGHFSKFRNPDQDLSRKKGHIVIQWNKDV